MSVLYVLNPTSHATAVYASCPALLPPHATLASRRSRYGLTWAGLAPADRASFGWHLLSFDHLIGDASNVGGKGPARSLRVSTRGTARGGIGAIVEERRWPTESAPWTMKE